jgi:hypothetical protein
MVYAIHFSVTIHEKPGNPSVLKAVPSSAYNKPPDYATSNL